MPDIADLYNGQVPVQVPELFQGVVSASVTDPADAVLVVVPVKDPEHNQDPATWRPEARADGEYYPKAGDTCVVAFPSGATNPVVVEFFPEADEPDVAAESGTGEPGPAGPAGPAGPKGDKGDKGDTGDTGATGATGPAGATGATGATGAKGDKGDKGDPGDDGAPGAPGAPGADGADGAPGSVIHRDDALSTEGAPSGAIGVDGDFLVRYCADVPETRFYGPKSGGSWVDYIVISGAPGSGGGDGSAPIFVDHVVRADVDVSSEAVTNGQSYLLVGQSNQDENGPYVGSGGLLARASSDAMLAGTTFIGPMLDADAEQGLWILIDYVAVVDSDPQRYRHVPMEDASGKISLTGANGVLVGNFDTGFVAISNGGILLMDTTGTPVAAIGVDGSDMGIASFSGVVNHEANRQSNAADAVDPQDLVTLSQVETLVGSGGASLEDWIYVDEGDLGTWETPPPAEADASGSVDYDVNSEWSDGGSCVTNVSTYGRITFRVAVLAVAAMEDAVITTLDSSLWPSSPVVVGDPYVTAADDSDNPIPGFELTIGTDGTVTPNMEAHQIQGQNGDIMWEGPDFAEPPPGTGTWTMFGALRYRVNPFGEVAIEGAAAPSGTLPDSGAPLFTLDTDHRPPETRAFNFGLVLIGTDGSITVSGNSALMDGVRFYRDGA